MTREEIYKDYIQGIEDLGAELMDLGNPDLTKVGLTLAVTASTVLRAAEMVK